MSQNFVLPVSMLPMLFLFLSISILYIPHYWNKKVHHFSGRRPRPTEGCQFGKFTGGGGFGPRDLDAQTSRLHPPATACHLLFGAHGKLRPVVWGIRGSRTLVNSKQFGYTSGANGIYVHKDKIRDWLPEKQGASRFTTTCARDATFILVPAKEGVAMANVVLLYQYRVLLISANNYLRGLLQHSDCTAWFIPSRSCTVSRANVNIEFRE